LQFAVSVTYNFSATRKLSHVGREVIMLLNRRICCTLIVVLLLSACASAGFTLIGSNGSTARFTPIGSTALSPPLPPNSPVNIYYSEKEVNAPFSVIGNISYRIPGMQQTFSLPDAVPDLEDIARKAGANGIIIDELVLSESEAIARSNYRTPFRAEARAILVEQ